MKKIGNVECSMLIDEYLLKLLDEDEIYNSMMSSGRRIKQLKISGKQRKNYQIENQVERLTNVISNFGHDIKHLELNFCELTNPLLKLLNLMPNLKKIVLKSVPDIGIANAEEDQLNGLHNLRMIESFGCNENVLNIFATLPPNCLESLKLIDLDGEPASSEVIKLFPNQLNIKHVETSSKFLSLLNHLQPKLQSLRLVDDRWSSKWI